MATESPTTWTYGPDTFDAIVGSNSALAFGDIDADGSLEVIVGIPNGDGPTNSTPYTGECRLAEFGGTFPTTLDLGTDARSTVFGIAESERFGSRGLLQDVNGDGIDDLCIDTLYGDGPDETRTNAGEVHILYGAPSFPEVIDLALTPPDIIVYGQINEDRISARDAVDLNGDGFLEIAINTGHALFTRLESLWLMSPFDFDGDGITQLEDNCPLVANPDQLDSDGDDRGDACAADWDGDGQADSEDCAPNRTSDGTPYEVLAVGFTTPTELTWSPAAFTDWYDILRGEPCTPAAGDYGACQNDRDPDPTDTAFVDPETPVAGAGFTYLIRGRNEFCSAAGSYGRTSDGTERTSQNPLACP